MALGIQHLLGLYGVSKSDIELILDTADSFYEVLQREIKLVPTLRGKTIVNLFYESSTRTRLSFELAEKRRGPQNRLGNHFLEIFERT